MKIFQLTFIAVIALASHIHAMDWSASLEQDTNYLVDTINLKAKNTLDRIFSTPEAQRALSKNNDETELEELEDIGFDSYGHNSSALLNN